MVKRRIETDEDAVALAVASREAARRLDRLQALTRRGEMADRGDFDEFPSDKVGG
jgi:hypothetical protein